MNKNLIALVVALGFAANCFAADSTQTVNYKQALASVSVLEMPSKAAQLVSQTPVKDREVITATVVKHAANLKPTALPAVVGAIAKATPEMAPTAAAVAAAEQPKLAADISKAAASAAPSQAVAIAQAVAQVLPSQAREVALMVASVAPADMAGTLVKMANETPNSTTTVAANTTGGTLPPRPPTIGNPYNPLPGGTLGQGSVTNSGAIPPGGRDYATP